MIKLSTIYRWQYIWHEMKRTQSSNNPYLISTFAQVLPDSSSSSEVVIQLSRSKEIIRKQLLELTNIKQEQISKRLSYQNEIHHIKDQLEESQKEVIKLKSSKRAQQIEKDVKLSEMASAIRSLSMRSELHQLLAQSKQDIENEKLVSIHLKQEVESYRYATNFLK